MTWSARFVTRAREQRSRRERDRQRRWMEQVAAEVVRLTDEREWERILVSGDDG